LAQVFGLELLACAMIGRLTHHVHIPEMNVIASASNNANAELRHPAEAKLYPSECASGEAGNFIALQFPFSPEITSA
jgi:hypothetical protein